MVKLLLNRGCDVNVGDKANGEAPLMMCIRMRNEKMASLILDLAKNLDVEKKVSDAGLPPARVGEVSLVKPGPLREERMDKERLMS